MLQVYGRQVGHDTCSWGRKILLKNRRLEESHNTSNEVSQAESNSNFEESYLPIELQASNGTLVVETEQNNYNKKRGLFRISQKKQKRDSVF